MKRYVYSLLMLITMTVACAWGLRDGSSGAWAFYALPYLMESIATLCSVRELIFKGNSGVRDIVFLATDVVVMLLAVIVIIIAVSGGDEDCLPKMCFVLNIHYGIRAMYFFMENE